MKVYISGGITGVDGYMAKFQAVQDRLEKLGYDVINPAKILSNMPLSTSYTEYMKLCMAFIDQCDEVYMMPEWENSKGATFEKHYAEIIGKYISGEGV